MDLGVGWKDAFREALDDGFGEVEVLLLSVMPHICESMSAYFYA